MFGRVLEYHHNSDQRRPPHHHVSPTQASVANFMLIESTTHTAKSIGAAYEYVE